MSAFRLDKYEVTVGRFRAFVAGGFGTQVGPPAAESGAHPKIPGSGWDPGWNTGLPKDTPQLLRDQQCFLGRTWTDSPGPNESRAVICISWYVAFAFCAWDGGRLPTQAEWSFVAGGGEEKRRYPWGVDEPDASRASYYDLTTKIYTGTGSTTRSGDAVIHVGSKPAGNGKWGHADLGGNAAEWVLDSWGAPVPSPCNDCASLMPSGNRLIRGGGFSNDSGAMMNAIQDNATPETIVEPTGIRCARD